jgi:hypothetical protein
MHAGLPKRRPHLDSQVRLRGARSGGDVVTDHVLDQLDHVLPSLRNDSWNDARHKPLADALRTTILELAELCDALAETRKYVELLDLGHLVKQGDSGAYVHRALAYANDLCEAVMLVSENPDDARVVRLLLVRALESWQPWLPWNVIYEVTEHHELESRFFELAGAWDRSARGVVHRLAALLRPRCA